MLFSVELLVFVMMIFLLWNHADMLQRLGSLVGYWMVRVVVICSHFVLLTNIARRSSCLNDLSDPAQASRLHNPVTFRSLDSFHRSWHAVISTIWDALPANLLLQGQATGWRFVLKDLQRCCY